MEFFPPLQFSLLGGWILLLGYIFVIGIIIAVIPKEVISKLYDTSSFTKKQIILSKCAKIAFFINFIIYALTPLSISAIDFIVGVILFVLGETGFIVAIINFKNTPNDKPVTQGFYTISRNPQMISLITAILGVCFAIGSWFCVIFLLFGAVFSHLRVLAEEQSCLEKYGQNYQDYMDSRPRYFLFF
ncbi:MAG: methyltransferase family protein [Promethearchaeota archaeon]